MDLPVCHRRHPLRRRIVFLRRLPHACLRCSEPGIHQVRAHPSAPGFRRHPAHPRNHRQRHSHAAVHRAQSPGRGRARPAGHPAMTVAIRKIPGTTATDAAPALAPPSAASLRRTGSLPQASRRPRTPPPVIRWPRSHRTAAPQVTIRCRETPAMPLPTSRRQATTCAPDLHADHRHAPTRSSAPDRLRTLSVASSSARRTQRRCRRPPRRGSLPVRRRA